jgi:HK97 family phage major capsid protein
MNVRTMIGGLVAMFAKAPTIQELEEKQVALAASAKSIQEAADREGRPLSEDEEKEVQGIFAAFESTGAEITRRNQIAKLEANVNAPGARTTTPAPTPAPQASAMPVRDGARIDGGDYNGATKGSAGFRSLGEMALLVKNAIGNPSAMDPRLRVLAAVPSTQSQEGVGADGGYFVPPDFRTNILAKVQGEDSLLTRCDQQTTSSNSITFPVDETTPWQTSGGVQAYWEGEGTPWNQSKVALNSVTVRANKIAALAPVTDELLEDANGLTAYLNKKVPDKMAYKINDALLNGDGAMKPLGVLQSPALVTQAAEGGQTAGTVVAANIVKMFSRMYAPLRRNAVWVVNQDLEQQLPLMTIGTGASAMPIYLPPNGLQGAPNAASPSGTLLGRPIIYTEAAQALGAVGDIALVDFSQYLALVKAGGMRQDVSIHLWFDYGLTAFRFTMRIGGMPWWAASITRAKSANTLSFAVALAAR